mmetsp:Transcript_15009/g.38568  ORF Transcript_15009/g.38568 Transcript_15009/m.38568 type:complete len:573 (+) Transcript_15009:2004-3722(+)
MRGHGLRQHRGPVLLVIGGLLCGGEGGHGEGVPGAAADLALLGPRRQDLVDVFRRECRLILRLVGCRQAVGSVLQEVGDAFAVRLRVTGRRAHAAQHRLVKAVFLGRGLEDGLLVGVARDEAVNLDVAGLPDAVAPRHGLQVILRVPVRVVQDDHIGCGEGDALPASLCGQKEHKAVGVILGEAVDGGLPGSACRAAVDALHVVPSQGEVVLQHVEHDDELAEDEHLVALLEERCQQAVQQLELAALRLELLAGRVHQRVVPAAGDEVRVVGHLAQLHQQVVQLARHAAHHAAVLRLLRQRVDERAVQQLLVELLLEGRHVRVHDDLHLAGQPDLHVALDAAEHEGPQQRVQLGDDLAALRLRGGSRVLVLLVVDVAEVEPRLKVREVAEHIGQDEVEQRPQLRQVVLQRRAGEQQLVVGGDGAQLPQQLAVKVLQPVALIHHDVLPIVARQRLGVPHEDLEARDNGRKGGGDLLAGGHALAADLGALRGGAMVQHSGHAGAEALHLVDPVGQRGEGREDEEGAVDALVAQVGEEADSLARLAKAHLVSEDAVEAVLVEGDHPLDAGELVVA